MRMVMPTLEIAETDSCESASRIKSTSLENDKFSVRGHSSSESHADLFASTAPVRFERTTQIRGPKQTNRF